MVETKNSYEVYKDSGVKWLGRIPEHWNIESFKNILKERNEKNYPIKSIERLSLSIDKGVTLYSDKTTNLDRFKDDFTQYKLAYDGDLVFNSMNMIVGAVGVSNYFGCVSPVYYTYTGKYKISTTKFYEYLFRSKRVQGVLYSLGKGLLAIDRGDGKYNTLRLKVSRDDLRSLKLPFPSFEEQNAIANFLDDKTTKIDQAIAIKEQQIALLKERKQIIIQEAVTKGLDATVKLKDSGVEWIGQIPEHWEMKRLKILGKIVNGATPSSSILNYWNGEINWLTPTDINDITYAFSSERTITKLGYQSCGTSLVPVGSIILTTRAPIGKVCIAGTALCTNQGCKSIVLKNDIINLFIYYSISISSKVLNSLGTGTTFMELSNKALKDFKIVLPQSIEEQKQIVAYIEIQSSKIDQAVSIKEQEIEKLKEYKVSLIDAVVTGKVRVC
ncbi:restriction endonuclease subunit S [Flavobacterium sp. GCM10023249]|uniref:restriction endonuclease subunit S n=1 Tax=unclassified Flavobacterium TaxID=196869 RepID=UPI003614E8B4